MCSSDLGLMGVSGNRKLYLNLLSDFARDYADTPDQVQTLLKNKNWGSARRVAHTVKGLSATLGAMNVHREFKMLETQIEKKSNTIKQSIDQAKIELDKIMTQISSALVQDKEKSRPNKVMLSNAVLKDKILPMLRELKKLASMSDMSSEDLRSEERRVGKECRL